MLEQIKKIARQSDECAAPALTLLRGTRESLEAGDGLALLRNRGGQEFLVLGRL